MAVNQRRSYDGNLCTIRYVGRVQGTAGDWFGVEWDNPTRGKHSGEHNGARYFTCLSKHPTAGSFVRPSRPSDKPRGFLEALREKYASEFLKQQQQQQQLSSSNGENNAAGNPLYSAIEISGKVVEEVGFDKIRKKLSELQELKIVLLDGLRVAGVLADCTDGNDSERNKALRDIGETCPKISELDLSRCLVLKLTYAFNLIDVDVICADEEDSGNRFGPVEEGLVFEGITELHLNDTLLSWDELSRLVSQFPSLTSLSASMNQITTTSAPISETITALTLDDNEIDSLSSVRKLAALPNLERLSLRGNYIDTINRPGIEEPIRFSPSLHTVDLSNNKINSWSFINDLPTVFPGLQSLRISGNPLYGQPVASSTITNMPERPMTVDEAYMLTLARLSPIQVLNYGNITPQDRGNGELYYLSLIGKELSVSPEDAEQQILAAHTRYPELCEKYGKPIVRRAEASTQGETVNPRSVAARLVKMVFRLSSTSSSLSSSSSSSPPAETTKAKEVPLSFDTYQVKAIVSRTFGLPPFEFRLIWETDELDPVHQDSMEEDGWDSEYDETSNGPVNAGIGDDTKFVKREVELVDSTRDIGFWLQDIPEARIRVDL